PFEGAFFPFINKAPDEDRKKYPHGNEAEEADFRERHRPGKEKRDLEIKDDEQNRNQVVTHVELHARVFKGIKAAFVRCALRRIIRIARQIVSEATAEAKQDARDERGNDEKNQSRQIVRKHFPTMRSALYGEGFIVPNRYSKVVPTAGFEPAQLAPLAPQASVSTSFTTSACDQCVPVAGAAGAGGA